MSKLKSVLTKEFMKTKELPLPYPGRLAEEYYREFCKPTYRSLAAKGPEATYLFFEKLGDQACEEQDAMIRQE